MIVATVLESHRAQILRYVTKMLKNPSDGEEVVQEVWLRALGAEESLREPGAALAWLYRIATHCALDRIRKRSRSVAIEDGADASELGFDEEDQPSVALELERQEMSVCVKRYIEQLSDEYRAVLFLTEFEGLSGVEVAEALGITLGTAKIRLHRARQELRDRLNQGCCFSRDERGVLVCQPK